MAYGPGGSLIFVVEEMEGVCVGGASGGKGGVPAPPPTAAQRAEDATYLRLLASIGCSERARGEAETHAAPHTHS